jgi:PPE-repeat protein
MTYPIWMAAPPEVHSALLSSGPGPGALLASAAAWSSLSIEYAQAADELAALLAAAQAGAWGGPTAATYVAAHGPYLSWLTQAGADSAATAAQQETAAAAYSAALACMPTLGELAANHATHAVLLATNFFGINAIPIALNEADYVRMWIQAATTMSVYQGVSTAAAAASPRTTAAPTIAKADATAGPAATSNPSSSLSEFLTQLEAVLNNFGAGGQNESLFSFLFNGVPPGTNPLSLILGDATADAAGYPAVLQALVGAAGNNPAFIALAYAVGGVAIVYDLTTQVLQFLIAFPLLSVGLAPLATIPAAFAGLAAGGIVGVAEVAAHVPVGVESVPPAPIAAVPAPGPGSVAAVPVPAPAAPAPALTPAAPAPAPAVAAPAAAAAPPPPAGPAGPFPYLVGGAARMSSPASAQAKAKRKAPQPDIAATPAAAAASARDQARARRRRRSGAEMLGRGYEYMDLDGDTDTSGPGPTPNATSERGAGTQGFAGTSQEVALDAAGLTTLDGDAFGGGPREPMMPSTWASEE